MSCCNLRILYGFSVIIQKQFFAYFSSFPRRSNISIRKTLEKIRNSYSFSENDLKYEIILAKNCFGRRRSCLYRSNNFIFYSYLKSCVWLLLVAVTLSITRASCERSFSKMKSLKKFARNSMTSESFTVKDWVTLISVAYLGYGRHGTCHGRHFDGERKNCLAKLKSLFTVSWTYSLRPMHS